MVCRCIPCGYTRGNGMQMYSGWVHEGSVMVCRRIPGGYRRGNAMQTYSNL